MKKKIAIIELDYHAEVLKSTCEILLSTPFDIFIFTDKEIASGIADNKKFSKLNWLIKEKESARKFIHKHLRLINSCDLIVFNTLASHFGFFSKLKLKPVSILRIHNANAYLAPAKHLKPVMTPYFIWKDFSHVVRKSILELDWFYRKQIMKKINYLAFPDEAIHKEAEERGLLHEKNVIAELPFSKYDPSFQKTERSEEIIITIPGTIDQRRRDYDLFFDALERIKKKVKEKVTVHLLGKPKDYYGHRIIKRCRDFESDKININYFKSRVDFDVFEKILTDTDFFVLPLVIDTKYQIYSEKYGYTKISGSINDLIKSGKPAIVNKEYPVNKRISNIICQFSGVEEMSELVLDWVNNKSFQKYQKNVDKALDFYKPENISRYYTDILSDIIKKEQVGHH